MYLHEGCHLDSVIKKIPVTFFLFIKIKNSRCSVMTLSEVNIQFTYFVVKSLVTKILAVFILYCD